MFPAIFEVGKTKSAENKASAAKTVEPATQHRFLKGCCAKQKN
jgi:hypothetical protein